jgi:hypothetical protein
MITTAGTIRECIFDDMYEYACNIVDGNFEDNTFLPILYELDKKEEWTDSRAWSKANPALGTIKKIDDLERKVEKAKNSPKDLSGVLTKDFNIRDTISSAWLTFDDINNDFIYNVKQNEIMDVGSMKHGNDGYILGTNRDDAILMKAQNYLVQLYDYSMKKYGSYYISDDSDNSDAQVNTGHALLSNGAVLFMHSEPSKSSDETPKSALMLMQTSEGSRQFRLTDYDSYSQLSVSEDKKKAALLVDSEKLLIINLTTAELK